MIYSLARGGAERMTVELARAWTNRGCQVTVLTLTPPETDFFQLDPRVERLHLPLPSDPKRGAVRRFIAALRRLVELRRMLVQKRPDIAVGMMSTAATLLALSSMGLKIRTFGSERTYPPMLPLGFAKEATRRLCYALLTGVFGQTEAAGRWLRQNTMARRVWVIPNHIDLPLIAHAPETAPAFVLGVERRCVLAVGRMTEEKQISRSIQAFSALAANFPEWDLVVVGEGPDRADLEALVAAEGLVGRVHMPGSVGNIGVWYGRADIFVMTSRYEGFPNALLEAMAHGVPPVAFDCQTGPSEMIRNGTNGLLVALDDMTGLVTGLERLMQDEPLRKRMGAEARLLGEHFSGRRVTALWFMAFGLTRKTRGKLGLDH